MTSAAPEERMGRIERVKRSTNESKPCTQRMAMERGNALRIMPSLQRKKS
jgi:hypothetical protein